MAIRFPSPKKTKNTDLTTPVEPQAVVNRQVVTEEVGLRPVRKAPDKKQLALLGLLLLVGLGALAYYLLPSLLPQDEPAPTPVAVVTPKKVASTPSPASSQTATSTASTASVPLNQQTVVITGDSLDNGVASAAASNSQTADNLPTPAPSAERTPGTDTPSSNTEVAFAGEDIGNKNSNQIAAGSQSSMSYAEFVQTSEMTVFADDGATNSTSSAQAAKPAAKSAK